MRGQRMVDARTALSHLLARLLGEDDEAALLGFKHESRVYAAGAVDRSGMRARLDDVRPSGGAASHFLAGSRTATVEHHNELGTVRPLIEELDDVSYRGSDTTYFVERRNDYAQEDVVDGRPRFRRVDHLGMRCDCTKVSPRSPAVAAT